MANQGRWVVVGMIGVALVAAAFAWSFRMIQGRRMVEFWGADTAAVIRLGKSVQLMQDLHDTSEHADIDKKAGPLGARDESAGSKLLGEINWDAARNFDISDAPGLVHARQALITDASFEWSAEANSKLATGEAWDVVRFAHNGMFATIRINTNSGHILHVESGNQAVLKPKIANGLSTLFAECRTNPNAVATE